MERCALPKIVHLYPAHPLFSRGFVPFLSNNFKDYGFKIKVFVLSGQRYESDGNGVVEVVRAYDDRSVALEVERALREYDLVFMHSLFCMPFARLLLLLRCGSLLDKIVWIEWGYDFYLIRRSGVAEWCKFFVKRSTQLLMARRIRYFVGIHPVDVEQYDAVIGGKARKFYIPYRSKSGLSPELQQYERVSRRDKFAAGLPLTVCVNHRADPDLGHVRVLDLLYKFKEENVRIVLPLSYGDRRYANEVREYAARLFGDKVVCLTELVSSGEYTRVLSEVDVFILNSSRQIALGNLNRMIFMEKKIYLPSDSVLGAYFKSNGVPIQDIESLANVDFKSFASEIDMSSGRRFVMDYYCVDVRQKWSELFDSVIKCYMNDNRK